MLKLIYEWLKLNFSVTGNPLTDAFTTAAIFAIFNKATYKIVGDFYRADLIDGRLAGSVLNFTIKIILLLFAMFIMWIAHLVKALF